MSTWTLVATWRSLVVDVAGVAEFHEQPLGGQGVAPGKSSSACRASRGVDGAAGRGDLPARSALPRRPVAGFCVVGVDVRARVLAPEARAAVVLVIPGRRHRDLDRRRRVRVVREVAGEPGLGGQRPALERVAGLGVDDHAGQRRRPRRRSYTSHASRGPPSVAYPAQLRRLAGGEARRPAALGHPRRKREAARLQPRLAEAGERGHVRRRVAQLRAVDGAVVDGDQAAVARDVGVEAGVVGLDPVDRLVVARGA